MSVIIETLFAMQDLEYKEFHSSLIPTVEKERVIGVRTPTLRAYVKKLVGTKEAEKFLHILPHYYYEENNVHACFIEQIKEFDACIEALNKFLPYVDNWATCDMMCPKVLKKDLPKLYEWIKVWVTSKETYTIRFGVNLLMKFYLGEMFQLEYAKLVASIRSDEYYVNMVVAWYFATALAKQYESILPFLEQEEIDIWTHNKTIQKAVESYRITKEQKEYLKTLKRK